MFSDSLSAPCGEDEVLHANGLSVILRENRAKPSH